MRLNAFAHSLLSAAPLPGARSKKELSTRERRMLEGCLLTLTPEERDVAKLVEALLQRQRRHAVRPPVEQGRLGPHAPFTFLGPATYVSHSGERPMAIVWRLQHAMPLDVFKLARVAAG